MVNKPAEKNQPMLAELWDKGDALVLQPDEGESYWQPNPANGYSTIKVSPRNCRSNHASFGVQVIAHGGRAGAGAVRAPGEHARGGKSCGLRPQDRRLAR